MTGTKLLQFMDLAYAYDGALAARNVTLDVGAGEIVALLSVAARMGPG